METDKFKRYNEKCIFFNLRLRKDKDQKYIDFLKKCPNRVDFIRKAIDREIG